MSHLPRNGPCDTFRRMRIAHRIIFGEIWKWEIPFASHRLTSEWVLGFSWHRTGYSDIYTAGLSEAVKDGISWVDRTVGWYNRDLDGGYVLGCLPVIEHAQCGYVTWAALNSSSMASCSEGDFPASFQFQMWLFVVIWYRLPCFNCRKEENGHYIHLNRGSNTVLFRRFQDPVFLAILSLVANRAPQTLFRSQPVQPARRHRK